MHRNGTMPVPTSVAFLTWVHQAFYDKMPEEFRVIEHPDGTQEPIIPGRMRQDGDSEIAVGRHHPPSSARVAAFMDHFGKRYQIAARSASGRIIAIASAHHRLNYIHPFPDGNGRVSRLMSHAMALNAGIGGQGLWSISRGLARGQRDRGRIQADDGSCRQSPPGGSRRPREPIRGRPENVLCLVPERCFGPGHLFCKAFRSGRAGQTLSAPSRRYDRRQARAGLDLSCPATWSAGPRRRASRAQDLRTDGAQYA